MRFRPLVLAPPPSSLVLVPLGLLNNFLGNFEWTDFFQGFFRCFSSPFSFLELKIFHFNFVMDRADTSLLFISFHR